MTADTLDDFFDRCPGLLFIADSEGALLRCSRAMRERFADELSRGEALASLASDDDDDRRALAELLGALASSEDSASCTLRASAPEGALRVIARRSTSGSIHGQIERTPARQSVIVEELLRTVMNTLDIVLWAIDDQGKFVFHDGKALATAGLERGQFLDQNIFDIYTPELMDPMRKALAGTASYNTSKVHGTHWETWHVPMRDAEDQVTHVVGLTLDITERIESKAELERQLRTIRSQQRAIHELSTPLLNVWDQVVTVPLIGSMDSARTDELTERLLAEVHRARTRFAILDLTGVEAVDTSIASHILRLLRSMQLLGVEGLVTGVSPQVAQTMVGVGIDFESVQTHRSLREGLRYCMRALATS